MVTLHTIVCTTHWWTRRYSFVIFIIYICFWFVFFLPKKMENHYHIFYRHFEKTKIIEYIWNDASKLFSALSSIGDPLSRKYMCSSFNFFYHFFSRNLIRNTNKNQHNVRDAIQEFVQTKNLFFFMLISNKTFVSLHTNFLSFMADLLWFWWQRKHVLEPFPCSELLLATNIPIIISNIHSKCSLDSISIKLIGWLWNWFPWYTRLNRLW